MATDIYEWQAVYYHTYGWEEMVEQGWITRHVYQTSNPNYRIAIMIRKVR